MTILNRSRSKSPLGLKPQSHQPDLTVDTVFVYLCQQESWISDVQIAMELETSIPIARKLLEELGDVVENDGDVNWRIIKTTEVEVVSERSDKLTIKEEKELLRLEKRVQRGFYIAGKALQSIRNQKLYRQEYKTFSDYCRERFNFSHRNGNYLIAAVEVMDNLLTLVNSKNGKYISQKNLIQFLPTSMTQALPLSKLPPQQQLSAWQKAISLAMDGKPTAKLVSMAVDEIKNQEKMDNISISPSEKENNPQNFSLGGSKLKEGLNYKPGYGCEWNVKVEQSIYEQLMEYRELNGFPTLNSAISNLLTLAIAKKI
jgi:hypothetical protein